MTGALPNEDRPLCGQFTPADGGARHWCAQCGWRWDYHPDEVDRRPAAALERLGAAS